MTGDVHDCAALEMKSGISRPQGVLENGDSSQAYTETEVRSKHGDSHLGHVSPDGALPKGRAEILHQLGPLRVIHRDQLGCERFGEYVRFFAKQEA
jgi:peptide-methionine (R)-S-oxide reductase